MDVTAATRDVLPNPNLTELLEPPVLKSVIVSSDAPMIDATAPKSNTFDPAPTVMVSTPVPLLNR